jgi:hypothetical protein
LLVFSAVYLNHGRRRARVGIRTAPESRWLPILFSPTETSQAAGRAYIERLLARADRDTPVSAS